jgi:histidyl-tRNA synthetase
MAYRCNPKLLDQLQYCEKYQIELCVIIGTLELQKNTLTIRDVNTREEV